MFVCYPLSLPCQTVWKSKIDKTKNDGLYAGLRKDSFLVQIERWPGWTVLRIKRSQSCQTSIKNPWNSSSENKDDGIRNQQEGKKEKDKIGPNSYQ